MDYIACGILRDLRIVKSQGAEDRFHRSMQRGLNGDSGAFVGEERIVHGSETGK
jgi:hypothetical protein